jgi:hypothetical protein
VEDEGEVGAGQLRGDLGSAKMNIAEKIAAVAPTIIEQRGDVDLLALFRIEGSRGWDLVFSASWAVADKAGSIEYIAEVLRESLTSEEMRSLTGIVVLEMATALLSARFGAVNLEHGVKNGGSFEFNELSVEESFFIILRPPRVRKDRTRH